MEAHIVAQESAERKGRVLRQLSYIFFSYGVVQNYRLFVNQGPIVARPHDPHPVQRYSYIRTMATSKRNSKQVSSEYAPPLRGDTISISVRDNDQISGVRTLRITGKQLDGGCGSRPAFAECGAYRTHVISCSYW